MTVIMQPAADRASAAHQQEKHVADDDGRNDQRQMDEPVQQALAGKARAGQQEGRADTEGQAAGDAPKRHPQAETNGLQFEIS
jgi:hypothetical protein